MHPIRGTYALHSGIDIPGPAGAPIAASAPGVVRFAGWSGGYGNLVTIDHGNGMETRYGHLSRLAVGAGARVAAGQRIGLMGSTGLSTGSHLHFEVRANGRATDPLPYFGRGASWSSSFDKGRQSLSLADEPTMTGPSASSPHVSQYARAVSAARADGGSGAR